MASSSSVSSEYPFSEEINKWIITITSDHVKDPKSFANKSLPKEEQVNFSYNTDGKIICPIEEKELELGTKALITICCRTVFAGFAFSAYVHENKSCWICKTPLNPDKIKKIYIELARKIVRNNKEIQRRKQILEEVEERLKKTPRKKRFSLPRLFSFNL